MTVTIEFNEKEQAIFKQIAQRQQAIQQELSRTAEIIMASKGHDLPPNGIAISEDFQTATFEVETKEVELKAE